MGSTAIGRTTIILTRADGSQVNLAQALDTVDVFIESKDLDMGAPDVKKLLSAIRVEMADGQFSQLLELILKYRDHLNDAVSVEPSVSLSAGDQPVFLRPPSSRYFRIRLQDASPSGRWKIHGIEFFGRPDGRRL